MKDIKRFLYPFSRSILLHFQFTDSTLFHLSCLLRPILSSIDDNKYAFARHRGAMLALREAIANARAPAVVPFSRTTNPAVSHSSIQLSKDKRVIPSIFVNRIRIVFKWLIRAFSGHLPPEELLILWDLVRLNDEVI